MNSLVRKTLYVIAAWAIFLNGCAKIDIQQPENTLSNSIENRFVRYLIDLGFRADMIEDKGNYFLVEGDIVFQKDALEKAINRLSKTTQAATDYGVDYSKVQYMIVKIDGGMPSSGSDNWRPEIEQAITEWNNVTNCAAQFQLDNSASSPDITILSDGNALADNVIASAEAPSIDGNPGFRIQVNLDFLSDMTVSSGTKKYNMVHEMGHCIGFRHTNWSGRNETTPLGIPHTPNTGSNPDPNSVMNGGTALNTWAGFSSWDVTAAQVLYPSSYNTPAITSGEIVFVTENMLEIFYQYDSKATNFEIWRSVNGGAWQRVHQATPYGIFDADVPWYGNDIVYEFKILVENFRGDYQTSFSNIVRCHISEFEEYIVVVE